MTIASVIARMLFGRVAMPASQPAEPPPVAEPPPPAGPAWHPLPGGVLELGDSGCLVQMITDPTQMPYRGIDPDGRLIIFGPDLSIIKSIMERIAAQRAEFDCPDNGALSIIARR